MSDFGTSGFYLIPPSPTQALATIRSDGAIEIPGYALIMPNGEIAFDPQYTPLDAAKQFWLALELVAKSVRGA